MKTKSVWKKLGKFKENGTDEKGARYFYSRQANHGNRMVKVIEQGNQCLCFPIVLEASGYERVAFHAKTIKSLVEFLEQGGN